MRAYNPATTRIAELLGAQPVTIQLAELPQALATGGVENFLTSSASGVDSKLHEQVKYFYDVNAWLPRNAVVVNTEGLRRAGQAHSRPRCSKVAAAAGERGWKVSEQKDAEYLKELGAKGMTVDKSSDHAQARTQGHRRTHDRRMAQARPAPRARPSSTPTASRPGHRPCAHAGPVLRGLMVLAAWPWPGHLRGGRAGHPRPPVRLGLRGLDAYAGYGIAATLFLALPGTLQRASTSASRCCCSGCRLAWRQVLEWWCMAWPAWR
jgi:hypothetical protein